MVLAGLTGFVADSSAGSPASRASDGAASLDGRATRAGGDEGGIVLSLKSVCANANPHPATINVTARISLEKRGYTVARS